MKKFIFKLLLFSIPFQGLMIWILAAPYSKEYGWNTVLKDCRCGGWIWRRMHENPKPVDLAFIGTSRTMCGVYDSLLQKILVDSFKLNVPLANFGVCRIGNDLHYALTKELLDTKNPAVLILEVQPKLKGESHMHFPYIADWGDITGAPLIVNTQYLYNFITGIQTRLIFHRDKILGAKRIYKDELINPDHSFVVVPIDGIAAPEKLEKAKRNRIAKPAILLSPGIEKIIYDLSVRTAKMYYEKIAKLCKERGTKLIFLDIPGYGNTETQPAEAAFYHSLGELWNPPLWIFNDPKNFFDPDHLNRKGATIFANWLAGEIAHETK